ncbi:unnamed protein product [Symbiodinium sp. KB8]|nr:unnamed protein product [Symbiodinium sp. KB8]
MERLWAPLLGRHGIPLRLAWGIHFTKWLQVLSFGAVAIVASSNAHPQLATAAKLSSWLTLARADIQLGVLVFYYAWIGALIWLLSLSGLWLLAAAFSGAFSPRSRQALLLTLRTAFFLHAWVLAVPICSLTARMLVCWPAVDPSSRPASQRPVLTRLGVWEGGPGLDAGAWLTEPGVGIGTSYVPLLFGGGEQCFSGAHFWHAAVSLAGMGLNSALWGVGAMMQSMPVSGTQLVTHHTQWPGQYFSCLAALVLECGVHVNSTLAFNVLVDFLPLNFMLFVGLLLAVSVAVVLVVWAPTRHQAYGRVVFGVSIIMAVIFMVSMSVIVDTSATVDLSATVFVLVCAAFVLGMLASPGPQLALLRRRSTDAFWTTHALAWVQRKLELAVRSHMLRAGSRNLALAGSLQGLSAEGRTLALLQLRRAEVWDPTLQGLRLSVAQVFALRASLQPTATACQRVMRRVLRHYPRSPHAHMAAAEVFSTSLVTLDCHQQLHHLQKAWTLSPMPWVRMEIMHRLLSLAHVSFEYSLPVLRTQDIVQGDQLGKLAAAAHRIHTLHDSAWADLDSGRASIADVESRIVSMWGVARQAVRTLRGAFRQQVGMRDPKAARQASQDLEHLFAHLLLKRGLMNRMIGRGSLSAPTSPVGKAVLAANSPMGRVSSTRHSASPSSQAASPTREVMMAVELLSAQESAPWVVALPRGIVLGKPGQTTESSALGKWMGVLASHAAEAHAMSQVDRGLQGLLDTSATLRPSTAAMFATCKWDSAVHGHRVVSISPLLLMMLCKSPTELRRVCVEDLLVTRRTDAPGQLQGPRKWDMAGLLQGMTLLLQPPNGARAVYVNVQALQSWQGQGSQVAPHDAVLVDGGNSDTQPDARGNSPASFLPEPILSCPATVWLLVVEPIQVQWGRRRLSSTRRIPAPLQSGSGSLGPSATPQQRSHASQHANNALKIQGLLDSKLLALPAARSMQGLMYALAIASFLYSLYLAVQVLGAFRIGPVQLRFEIPALLAQLSAMPLSLAMLQSAMVAGQHQAQVAAIVRVLAEEWAGSLALLTEVLHILQRSIPDTFHASSVLQATSLRAAHAHVGPLLDAHNTALQRFLVDACTNSASATCNSMSSASNSSSLWMNDAFALAAVTQQGSQAAVEALNTYFDSLMQTRTIQGMVIICVGTLAAVFAAAFLQVSMNQTTTRVLKRMAADRSKQGLRPKVPLLQGFSSTWCLGFIVIMALIACLFAGLMSLFSTRLLSEDRYVHSVNMAHAGVQMQVAGLSAIGHLFLMLDNGGRNESSSFSSAESAFHASLEDGGGLGRAVFGNDPTGFMVSAAPEASTAARLPSESQGSVLAFQDSCSVIDHGIAQERIQSVLPVQQPGAAQATHELHRSECDSVAHGVLQLGWQRAWLTFLASMETTGHSLSVWNERGSLTPSCSEELATHVWSRLARDLAAERASPTSLSPSLLTSCAALPHDDLELWVRHVVNATLLQVVHFDDMTRTLAVLSADAYLGATELYAVTTLTPLFFASAMLFLSKLLVVDPVLRRTVRTAAAAHFTTLLQRMTLWEPQLAGSAMKPTGSLAERTWTDPSASSDASLPLRGVL